MAKAISTSTGYDVIGETVIKDKEGNLLVQFSSKDAETTWGQIYEAERIKYAMRNRRKNIPFYLRTGERPEHLVRTALCLAVKNILRR